MEATARQIAAVQALARAIVDSVREADRGMGVPAGPMYAAMMAHGVTLDQFNQLMGVLVRLGKLRQSGDLYFAV